MHAPTDTIIAVSSPPGRSPRGLIRLSGPDTPAIIGRMTDRPRPVARQLTPCRVRLHDDGPVLPALLTCFTAPHSYTGDDLAELQVPGHPALLDRLIHRGIDLGARLADAGEFTFRAYLAGKLDLTQAEGVAATIAAASDSQLQAATLLREGELGRFAAALVDTLATQLALVEAGIDFVDQDDVVPIAPSRLHANLTVLRQQLADLLAHSRSWASLEALPRVVLVGAPSTGKSTLFNALLGRRRAVTSDVRGTTRDVLAEPLRLETNHGQSVEVMLLDIAGLDDPLSLLDRQVQQAAREAIRSADLLLWIDDGVHAVSPSTTPGYAADAASLLYIRSKSDACDTDIPTNAVAVSARTGRGLAQLRQAIARALGQRGVSIAADMLALQPRHETSLRRAHELLAQATDCLAPQVTHHAINDVEIIASLLRTALDELAALGGHMTPDDVIGRVFATFCIGK
ncbi:MAG: GTPase [Phycisphaeraceae bacterium]